MATATTLQQRTVYNASRMLARLAVVFLFHMRCKGRRNIPAEGAVLICANHQSYLDPPLVGLAFDRRLNYVARRSLFRNPLFRRLIEFYGAIELDAEGRSLGGIKETLRRLKRGEMVLIFPEGTRTHNGEVQPLKSGFCTLARRSRAALLPVGIDGAYDVLSRSGAIPRPAPIHVCIGRPIQPSETAAMDDDSLVAELESRIRACHEEARAGRLR